MAGLFGEFNIHGSYHQYKVSFSFSASSFTDGTILMHLYIFIFSKNIILGIRHTWLLVPQMRRKLMMDRLQSKIEK